MSTTQQEYKNFLQDSSWYKHVGEGGLEEASYLAMGLVGEAGEYTDGIKKIARKVGYGDPKGFVYEMNRLKSLQVDELGDNLWYLVRSLDAIFGITIEQLMVLNTVKLYERLLRMHVEEALPISMPEWPFTHVTYEEARKWRQQLLGTIHTNGGG